MIIEVELTEDYGSSKKGAKLKLHSILASKLINKYKVAKLPGKSKAKTKTKKK